MTTAIIGAGNTGSAVVPHLTAGGERVCRRVPGNAVLSVGNLWGNAVPARTCGISVGRADALLSPS
jgi:hypothetical protein